MSRSVFKLILKMQKIALLALVLAVTAAKFVDTHTTLA